MPRFVVRRRVEPSDERLKRSTPGPHRSAAESGRNDTSPGSYLQDLQRRAGNSATLQLLGSSNAQRGTAQGLTSVQRLGNLAGTGTIQRAPSSVKDKIDMFEKGGSTGSSGGSSAPVISDRVSDFKSLLSKFKGMEGAKKETPPPTAKTDRPPVTEEKDPRTPGGLSYGGGSAYTTGSEFDHDEDAPLTSGGVTYGGSSYTSSPYTTGSEFDQDEKDGALTEGGVGYGSKKGSGGYSSNVKYSTEDEKDGALTEGGVGYGSKKGPSKYSSNVKYGTADDLDKMNENDDDYDLDDDSDEEEPEVKAKEPEYDSFEPGRKHGRTLSKFKNYEGEEVSSINNLQDNINDLKKSQEIRANKGITVSLGELAIEQLGWSQSDVDNYLSESGELKLPKVKYLSEPTERTSYELTGGSPLVQGADPKPFTTDGMFSKHSGKDWGIYVMDPGGKLFAGQHRVGLFHHSSFMAGANVAGAGELKVSKDGRLEHITNKTGHYRGDADHLWQAVDEFKDRGISLSSFKVSTFNGTIQDQLAETFYKSHSMKQLKLKEESPKPVEETKEDYYSEDEGDGVGYTSEKSDQPLPYASTIISDENDEGGSKYATSGGYVPNDSGGYKSDEKDQGGGYTTDEKFESAGYTTDQKGGGYTTDEKFESAGYTTDQKGGGYTTDEKFESAGYTTNPEFNEDKDDEQEDDLIPTSGGYTTNYTSKYDED